MVMNGQCFQKPELLMEEANGLIIPCAAPRMCTGQYSNGKCYGK